MQLFTSTSSRAVAPTTVLVSRSFGEYRPVPSPPAPELTLGAVGLEPVNDPTLPVIWGVHPPPPLPGLLDTWRHELAVSTALAGCQQPAGDATVGSSTVAPHRGIVTAGDFNATLRHEQVLASGPLTPISAELHEVGTSDHRALSTLVPLDRGEGN